MRDFSVPPRYNWNLRSSGLLRSVDWWLITDCQTPEDGTDRLYRNNYQNTMHDNPEEQMSQNGSYYKTVLNSHSNPTHTPGLI